MTATPTPLERPAASALSSQPVSLFIPLPYLPYSLSFLFFLFVFSLLLPTFLLSHPAMGEPTRPCVSVETAVCLTERRNGRRHKAGGCQPPSRSPAIRPWSQHACLIQIQGASAFQLLKGVCVCACVRVCVSTPGFPFHDAK